MQSYFDRVTRRDPPWPEGREDLHWHVLPDTAQTRTLLYEPYRDLTRRDGLVPVRPEWYHMTIQHGPPAASVSNDDLTTIIELVRNACAFIAPFRATVDRPQVAGVAVECPMRPGKQTRRLWQSTTSATRQVLREQVPIIPEVYYPHLSLAYATAEVDHRPMKAWLADCPKEPVTFWVERISLVAQRHDGREITWRHLVDIPLTGTTPSAGGQ